MVALKIHKDDDVTILIHDDYCSEIKDYDISQILSRISEIISNSYSHINTCSGEIGYV